MSDAISQDRRDQLDYRVAAIVAYVTERVIEEYPAASASLIMRDIYLSERYRQLADYDTYLYTYTFDEMYKLFLEELREKIVIQNPLRSSGVSRG
jgi:hypothetical protein